MADIVSDIRRYYGPCEGVSDYSDCHPHVRYFLLFSGGRDSFLSTYAFLEALSEFDDLEFYIVYVDHFMDYPWMRSLAFRALEFFESHYNVRVHFVTPSETFWSFIFRRRYLFPTPEKRWYVRHLVVKPLREFFNRYIGPSSLNYDAVVMGSRYEDSSSKDIKPVTGILNWGIHNVTGLHAVFPIAGLTFSQVRDLVFQTPLSDYNLYYPLSGGKPGFWPYLAGSNLSYLSFARKLGLPASQDLYDFVDFVSALQRNPASFGQGYRRWNNLALLDIFDFARSVYRSLSDAYPGLYSGEEVNESLLHETVH